MEDIATPIKSSVMAFALCCQVRRFCIDKGEQTIGRDRKWDWATKNRCIHTYGTAEGTGTVILHRPTTACSCRDAGKKDLKMLSRLNKISDMQTWTEEVKDS